VRFDDVTVCIPWRPQPSRLAAYYYVKEWYAKALPGCHFTDGDSGDEVFNRADSRNDAVRKAKTEMIVVADADTICDSHVLREAIVAAREDGLLHFPFHVGIYLDLDESVKMYESEMDDLFFDALERVEPHASGAHVMRKSSWWEAGGMDWRFTGWGGEDDAFIHACRAILCGVIQHPGLALILWHEAERDIGSSRWQPNSDLASRYRHLRNDKESMLELVKEKWADRVG
jgi:hypothetical protein